MSAPVYTVLSWLHTLLVLVALGGMLAYALLRLRDKPRTLAAWGVGVLLLSSLLAVAWRLLPAMEPGSYAPVYAVQALTSTLGLIVGLALLLAAALAATRTADPGASAPTTQAGPLP